MKCFLCKILKRTYTIWCFQFIIYPTAADRFQSFCVFQGGFALVPREKSYLKLRSNVAKQICLTVKQVMSNDADAHSLQVERCFGVLVSPGRHVRHSDMQLLDIVS